MLVFIYKTYRYIFYLFLNLYNSEPKLCKLLQHRLLTYKISPHDVDDYDNDNAEHFPYLSKHYGE